MYFESALNVAWLSLGVLGLAATIRASFRSESPQVRRSAWFHGVGVALIVVALFPYISATDDVLRIEHWNAEHQHSSKQSQNDQLIRLYETIDTPLICRICEVAFTFFFISLVFTPVARLVDRIAPAQAGRSPPLAAGA